MLTFVIPDQLVVGKAALVQLSLLPSELGSLALEARLLLGDVCSPLSLLGLTLTRGRLITMLADDALTSALQLRLTAT